MVWFFILGALIAIWPRAKDVLARQETLRRSTRAVATAVPQIAILVALAMGFPANVEAQSDGTSSLHAGTVEIHDPEERRLFGHLLCQCGSCQRLPLDSCGCSWAEDRRAELRARLAADEPVDDIIASFRAQWGPAAIAIPADEGMDRALWAVPVAGFIFAFGLIFFIGRRWKSGVREDDDEDDGTMTSAMPTRTTTRRSKTS